MYNLKYIDCDYDNNIFHEISKGLEKEPERGIRCHKCYKLRLLYTAKIAKDKGFEYFSTTLTVSPYKNEQLINEIGLSLENKYQVKWLCSDFKKENLYCVTPSSFRTSQYNSRSLEQRPR